MKTLILKHNGHVAHVPYELPVGDWFDVFVPDHGICNASVMLRSEDIRVEEVTPKGKGLIPDAIPGAENHPAVLEQAGDVCAVFELAFNLPERQRAGWSLSANDRNDLKVLSTIAEMAHLESDLHTAWGRLPDDVRGVVDEPEDDPDCWKASRALQGFIENTLVSRAQDLATAAAKRREAEWCLERDREAASMQRSSRTDLAIDLAKERA